ncbi:MAG: phosphodiesterase [Gammaproteobacteria bacterium]|nr:phosphodiesterase [Gammaproteobacteria bacterium]
MTLRVLHITDTHLFATPHARHRGLDTEATLEAVIGMAATHPWDLVLVTGDLVHDGAPEGYRRLADHLDVFGVPALCIPGNHDDPAALAGALPRGALAWQGLHEAAPWTLLMLDSHLPGAVGGELGEMELQRLTAELAGGEGPVLIALHHPPVAVGSAWMDTDGLRDAAAFWDVVDPSPRVKGVLWGHIHQAFDTTRSRIRLMASPSTGLQFTPHSPEFALDPRPPGYRRLLLDSDGGIDSEVLRLPRSPGSL